MADDKKYNPLSEEEQLAISGMSIDDLLASVKASLDAPVGSSTQIPVKPASADATPAKPAPVPAPAKPAPAPVPASAPAAAKPTPAPVPAPAAAKPAPAPERKPASRAADRTPAPNIPAPEFLRAREEKPKKKRSFGMGLLVYIMIFLAVAAAGTALFWKYLESYESSRPDNTADAYMATVDEAYWEELVMTSELFHTTDFERASDIAGQCFAAVRGQGYTIRRRAAETTPTHPVYTVRAGSTELARVTMRRSGSAGFGFYTWEVSTVELLESFVPEARTVEIDAPAGAKVTLNGIPLTEAYLTETTVYAELSELEKNFTTEKPSMAVYKVEGLYGNLELLVVDQSGAELAPSYADGSLYTYEMNISKTYNVTITAPRDARLYLNGALVPEEYVTAQEEYALLLGDEDYLSGDDIPAMAVYTVKGLLTPVETVTATSAGGTALVGTQNEDGNWSFGWLSGQIDEENRQLVEDFMDAYLDFSSDVNNNTEGNWYDVQQYLLYEGDAYQRFYLSLDGLEWTQSYDATLNDVEIHSYVEFGESCFVVRLTMNSTVTRANGTVTADMDFDVVFVRSDGQWLVEKMEAV